MNKRAQVETWAESTMLPIGIIVCFVIFAFYMGTLAEARESTLLTQINFQESRVSYRNLFEVKDEFGVTIGDRISSAAAAAVDQTFSGPQKDLQMIKPYYDSWCDSYKEQVGGNTLFKDTYNGNYDISEYNLRAYVKCYMIPTYFNPIFGANYRVTVDMGGETKFEAGNPAYAASTDPFYLAAPAGNADTLVEVMIAGEIA